MSYSRIFYSLSQAASQTAATADNLKKLGLPTAIVMALTAGSLEGAKAYSFQGASIDAEVCHPGKELSQGENEVVVHIEETTPLLKHTNTNTNTQTTITERWHWLLSLGLNTSSVAFTISNRYFLMNNLIGYFGLVNSVGLIWPIVLCDSAFKIMFDLTNELYETNTEFAEYCTKQVNAKPVYAHWRVFKFIASTKYLRDFLAIIGTIEHSIVDDILPWLLFIPQSTWEVLTNSYTLFTNASKISQALCILTPIFGGLLALVITFQTLLFETEHSYIAYSSILSLQDKALPSLYDRMKLGEWVKNILKYSSYIMPVCHGVASAAPVYVVLTKLLDNFRDGLFRDADIMTTLKGLSVVIVSLLTFTGTAVGHYYSEFKEAKAKLEELGEVVVTR